MGRECGSTSQERGNSIPGLHKQDRKTIQHAGVLYDEYPIPNKDDRYFFYYFFYTLFFIALSATRTVRSEKMYTPPQINNGSGKSSGLGEFWNDELAK